jgi:hypothetical protein
MLVLERGPVCALTHTACAIAARASIPAACGFDIPNTHGTESCIERPLSVVAHSAACGARLLLTQTRSRAAVQLMITGDLK